MAWSRKSRHERGYGSSWDKLRKTILARDKHLCQPCKAKGRITAAHAVDHIKPKAKGGTDEPNNLQAICTPCNHTKALQESADARGVKLKAKPRIALDGWPIED